MAFINFFTRQNFPNADLLIFFTVKILLHTVNEHIGIRQFLLVKIFPTLIRQYFPPSKFYAIQ